MAGGEHQRGAVEADESGADRHQRQVEEVEMVRLLITQAGIATSRNSPLTGTPTERENSEGPKKIWRRTFQEDLQRTGT